MPGNAGLFFRQLMSIAAFDFYEFGDLIHEQFAIPETESINANFESIGFESVYCLVNIGTMFLFYLLYILCVVIMLALRPCAIPENRRTKRIQRKLRNRVKYGALITLIYETYAIIMLSVLINLQ